MYNIFDKLYFFSIPKLWFLSFLMAFTLIACSKAEVVSELTFQKQLIGGTGSYQNTKKVWKLDSLAIDGKPFTLTTNQKKYTKSFSFDGAYIDSDGFAGNWTLTNINELSHTTIATVSGNKMTSSYQIVEVNAAQLNLKLNNTTAKYEYFFVIGN